jgi:hypothetical protein
MEVIHTMKYDPKLEVTVFLAIQENKEATETEIKDYLKEHLGTEISQHDLRRYIGKFQKGKIIAVTYRDEETLWHLADIPAWYNSGIMAICKGTTNEKMRDELDGLNERLKTEGRIIEPRSVWGGYKEVELTFETVDPILGGWISKEDGETIIPNYNGKRFIPANWFKGWIGSNAGLMDLPESIRFHIQVENGQLPDFTPLKYQLKVRQGLNTYEAIPPKTQFTVTWTLPTRGSKLKTIEQWMQFIKRIAERPLRGLGANPYAMGGRVKLVNYKPLT